MQKEEMDKATEDYKKIWDDFPLDYEKNGLPTVKLSYANILSRPLFYPTDKFSYGLALLMRRKSFTKKEVEHMRVMGFVVEIEIRQLELPKEFR